MNEATRENIENYLENSRVRELDTNLSKQLKFLFSQVNSYIEFLSKLDLIVEFEMLANENGEFIKFDNVRVIKTFKELPNDE